MRSDLVDIACELRHETKEAILIHDGAIEAWLPKSLAEFSDGEATMPEWLAYEKGLI